MQLFMTLVKPSNKDTSASPSSSRPALLPALGRFTERGVAIRLFLTCWLVFGLHFATNIVREVYPAITLGDHLSFDVSEYLGLHPDIFQIPGRGAYINNNPGSSILGAIPYALARPGIDQVVERVKRTRSATGALAPQYNTIYPMANEFYEKAYARGLDVKLGLAAGVMQVFVMAPLSALSVVVMFYVLLGLAFSMRGAVLLALLYALATPVFYRTAQLNQNLLVGHFAFLAFAMLWRPWDGPWRPRTPRFLIAGLLAGWTVVLDYSGMVVLLGISLYAFLRHEALPEHVRDRTDLLRFGLGAAAAIAVLIGYQWWAFGSPFFPAQHYMPPVLYSNQGFNGMDWPQPDLLWDTTFGLRFGLFVSAPVFLLALLPSAWLRKGGRLLGMREARFVALFSFAFLLFCSANLYGRLQFNSGVRYIVPVIPFLFLVVAGVLKQMPKWLAVLIGVGALFWSWCLTMYRDVEQGLGVLESIIRIPLEGIRLPWLKTLERMGYVPNATLFTVIVLGVLAAVLLAMWGGWPAFAKGCAGLGSNRARERMNH